MNVEKGMKKSEMKVLAAGSDCQKDVASMLRNLGYVNIIETPDAVTTWNYLKKDKADIVFADWMLGQFDGLVLLKIMMADANLSKIPVILMCTTINREMVIDAGHAGVSGVLVPPFNEDIIEQKMETMFEIIEDHEKDVASDTLLEEGLELLEEGNYDTALEKFTTVIEMYESPEVYYNIGYIKASQKRYDESIIAFRKAIKIDQKFARAYKALGEVFLKTGQTEKAEDMMQRAGEIYMEQNMSQEAELAFHEVLKLNPNTTNIYNSLGILYRRNNDFIKAIQAYEKALRVDPEDENIFFNLGRACFDAKQYKRAVLYFNRAVEIYPDFEEAKAMVKKIEKRIKAGD